MKTSRNIGRFLTTVVVVTVLACTANGRTIYVDDDAAGANDGSSWANAYTFLQDALAVAVDGDEIMVAQGTYRPDQGNGQGLGDRTATFRLMNGVTIIGGYAGVGEQNPDAHDVELYGTILSGDLNGDDVEVADARDLLTQPTRADNSYHVVNAMEADTTSVLDGLTITGGNADGTGPDSTASCGGGMLVYDGSPTVIDCDFICNSASGESPGGGWGGGMYIDRNGSPTLTNCTFNENAAGGLFGGGIHNFSGSPTLINCTLSKNWAERSGGGMINGGSPTLTDCTFNENSAGQAGGGIYSERGDLTVDNCTFTNNNAEEYGGAIANHSQTEGTISDCVFTGNVSSNGGAISNNNESNVKYNNCLFSNNKGTNYGGGMYNDFDAKAIVTDCTFVDNDGGDGGGGIMNQRGGSATVTESIFNGNWSNNGGGVYNRETSNKITLTNCVLSSNSSSSNGGGVYAESGNPSLTNCIFEGNQTGWSGGGAFCQGSGTFSGCTFNENTAAHGGGLYHLSALDAVIEDCMFTANQCIYEGAALALDAGNANIVACKFQENVAQWNGGAIMIHPAEEKSHKITHCEFVANTTLGHGTNIGGGAIMDRGNETAVSYCVFEGNRSFGNLQEQSGLGGAVYCNGAATTLINCTFAGNFANAGCALACDAYETPGDAIVSNCIMWDDGEEIWIGPDSIASITYSDIQITDGEVYPGPNNININPNFTLPGHWSDRNDPNLLLDPGNADAIWVAGDYQLLEGSPCVNAGDNSAVPEWIETDLDGNPHIGNDIVDMGAYEFTIPPVLEVYYTAHVSLSQDDGYATNGQLQNLNSDFLKVGSSSFAQPPYYASGMVFRNVSIPQGAEILSAHLRIRSYNSRLSDEVYGRIQAEATDDTLGFGAFGNIGTLPGTTALVDWDLIEPWAADTWYTSPDIAGVVQEVVDRGGWVEGNSLAIIYSTRENMGGYRSISSFDRGSDSAPILEITYVP